MTIHRANLSSIESLLTQHERRELLDTCPATSDTKTCKKKRFSFFRSRLDFRTTFWKIVILDGPVKSLRFSTYGMRLKKQGGAASDSDDLKRVAVVHRNGWDEPVCCDRLKFITYSFTFSTIVDTWPVSQRVFAVFGVDSCGDSVGHAPSFKLIWRKFIFCRQSN